MQTACATESQADRRPAEYEWLVAGSAARRGFAQIIHSGDGPDGPLMTGGI
jgi:hypothetical protein